MKLDLSSETKKKKRIPRHLIQLVRQSNHKQSYSIECNPTLSINSTQFRNRTKGSIGNGSSGGICMEKRQR